MFPSATSRRDAPPGGFTPVAIGSRLDEQPAIPVDAGHFARRLHLERDRLLIAGLGERCADYLRSALDRPIRPREASGLLPRMLRPTHVPVEHSGVLGIFAGDARGSHLPERTPARPVRLAGVLFFLRPPVRSETWFITLFLLDPAARGRGLGAAVHAAFARWAYARGADRLMAAVADNNARARRFWQEHLGYRETTLGFWRHASVPRKHREFELVLDRRVSRVPWAA